jgi:drug/metabolite transporter (DMT)-like permease
MSWIVFALVAPLIFTVVNFIDKLIIEKQVHDPLAMPGFVMLTSFVSGSVLWLLTGSPLLPLGDALLVMFTGALTAVGAAIYFNALSLEETSRIIFFIQLQPVITLVFSYLFLDESISAVQLVGFVLILSGVLALALKDDLRRFSPSRAFWMIVLVDLIWVSSVILFKLVVKSLAFMEVLSYESWGLALGSLLIYLLVPRVRRAFNHTARTVPRRVFGIIFANEFIFVVAKLIGFVAIALGPVALVAVLGGTQVFFGIILGWALTFLAPSAFKEDISRRTLLRKGGLAVVLVAGIGLISA